MTERRRALLLINPNSRIGNQVSLDRGLELLRQGGLDLVEVKSENAESSRENIARYRDSVDLVILGGGDGTISSAITSLYQHGLPLAILPLGTANDLARSLGIPEDLEQACRIVLGNHRARVDLGEVNGHLFFNAANIGLGVRVTHSLTRDDKRRWGVLSYVMALVNAYRDNQPFRARVVVDGRSSALHSMQIAVGNGRYYGGGTVIDQEASIDEGLLHLYSLPPQSFGELLALAPVLREGRQRQVERAFTASGRRIELSCSRELEIDADGEPVTRTPAVFRVIPGALEVLLPTCGPAHEDTGAGSQQGVMV